MRGGGDIAVCIAGEAGKGMASRIYKPGCTASYNDHKFRTIFYFAKHCAEIIWLEIVVFAMQNVGGRLIPKEKFSSPRARGMGDVTTNFGNVTVELYIRWYKLRVNSADLGSLLLDLLIVLNYSVCSFLICFLAIFCHGAIPCAPFTSQQFTPFIAPRTLLTRLY